VTASPYTFPIARCDRRFEAVWAWLDELGGADWERVHSLARHFHPAYVIAPDTGAVDHNRAPGAVVFEMMERGEYVAEWVRILTPTLWRVICAGGPAKSRGRAGVPDLYRYATLHVSAVLACHEWERLQFELEQRPPDGELIALHLYWFERFVSVWTVTGIDKPPTWEQNQKRKSAAKEWASDLMAFHLARGAGRRKPSMRESADAWVKFREGKGVSEPAFDRAYEVLRREVKAAAGDAKKV